MLGQELIEPAGEPGAILNNPDYPYLTIYLDGTTETLPDGSTYDTSGYYYLVAMTNA